MWLTHGERYVIWSQMFDCYVALHRATGCFRSRSRVSGKLKQGGYVDDIPTLMQSPRKGPGYLSLKEVSLCIRAM